MLKPRDSGPSRPMASRARSTTAPRPVLSEAVSDKDEDDSDEMSMAGGENLAKASRSALVRSGPGMRDTLTPGPGLQRRTTSVAMLVQTLSLAGKDMPEMASSTDDLPADWSLQTMISVRSMYLADAVGAEAVDDVEQVAVLLRLEREGGWPLCWEMRPGMMLTSSQNGESTEENGW